MDSVYIAVVDEIVAMIHSVVDGLLPLLDNTFIQVCFAVVFGFRLWHEIEFIVGGEDHRKDLSNKSD